MQFRVLTRVQRKEMRCLSKSLPTEFTDRRDASLRNCEMRVTRKRDDCALGLAKFQINSFAHVKRERDLDQRAFLFCLGQTQLLEAKDAKDGKRGESGLR